MKKHKTHTYQRLKVIGVAVASLAAGIALLAASQMIHPTGSVVPTPTQPATTQPATTQPATTQPAGTLPAATQPASPGPDTPADKPAAPNSKAAAQNMSGLLLLFSMMGFGLAIVCAGWVVYDIRRSRPAWKTQTKYPTRR